MFKYYAVKRGRKTGIFNSWSECYDSVMGYEKPIYRGFNNLEEAQKFLGLTNGWTFYIDGSFKDGTYGSGIVALSPAKKFKFSFKGNDHRFVGSRNVAGELMAAIWVLRYISIQGIKNATIVYDYSGIESWANGTWKAKNPLAQIYVKVYLEAKKSCAVTFVKVTAHSGNKYNELADKLAKEAIGGDRIINLKLKK